MPRDSDVALLGTGVAPLVAASHLLAQGKSVIILNPDWDFFLEDSELALDPLLPFAGAGRDPARFRRSLLESVIAELRPDFPGAVEAWPAATPGAGEKGGYHDLGAPHVRARSRLLISASEATSPPGSWGWEDLEELYVLASDAGLHPQIVDGLPASKRFPGFSATKSDARGLLIPKLADVDVSRYRNGLLEFVRERLEPEQVVCSAGQIELMPEGLRFHAGSEPRTVRVNENVLVFWTPRLSQWVLAQAKKHEVHPVLPKGLRIWEEWSLNSRDPLDPQNVGMFEDMAAWAEIEGDPSGAALHRLSVLRAGPLTQLDARSLPRRDSSWASAESFQALSGLCGGYLNWEKFSVRSLKPRMLFEWDEARAPWPLTRIDQRIQVVPGADGPLFEVVRRARAALRGAKGAA